MYDHMQLGVGGAHHVPPSVEDPTDRVPIYTQEFAQDPHAHYRWMRQEYGSIVPVWLEKDKTGVEVPAWLVVEYATAVKILHDPGRFPADPRKWQANLPVGLELNVFPMMEYRPNALRNTGPVHARFRAAANDALENLDLNGLHLVVEQTAKALVDDFPRVLEARRAEMRRRGDFGEPVIDLIGDYFTQLVFRAVVSHILGCPDDIGQQIADASKALFDAQHTREEVNAMMNGALLELCNLKKMLPPTSDVTSALVRHPAKLSDEELIHAQVTNCSAGIEITVNLAANALLLMLTDERFNQHSAPGQGLHIHSAIDEILAVDPPLANLCITYPPSPVNIDGTWLPANQPVIISMAACSSDPAYGAELATGNRASLAWGGPSEHSCPAKAQTASYMIAADAIDQLLDFAPEIALAVSKDELNWRPGPFHRALADFPVVDPSLM